MTAAVGETARIATNLNNDKQQFENSAIDSQQHPCFVPTFNGVILGFIPSIHAALQSSFQSMVHLGIDHSSSELQTPTTTVITPA